MLREYPSALAIHFAIIEGMKQNPCRNANLRSKNPSANEAKSLSRLPAERTKSRRRIAVLVSAQLWINRKRPGIAQGAK